MTLTNTHYLWVMIFAFNFIFTTPTYTQVSPQKYAKVKISLQNNTISEIAALGLEYDHGEYAKGRYLINIFSEEELATLRLQNIPYKVIIEDMTAHYLAQQHPVAADRNSGESNLLCEEDYLDYRTPVNYREGSMGGYLTYQELLNTLDSMQALFPHLISKKATVGQYLTEEGRPIHWIRISNNPTIEETEPEILYTALHHAREPNSMQQMIFFMWHLLEQYEIDKNIKRLVDNTQFYFIPCVNPDGYVYNEQTNPLGGGLWRKNRAKGVTGHVHGVDLNRNYGYLWGGDEIGSSSNVNRLNYRGTAPFSEPETQAVRDFCKDHQFQIALNYHTAGNLLIIPWGFDSELTEDDATFRSFGKVMTQENRYKVGTGTGTIGYVVNGSSDDWMYGEEAEKNKIFAMTPEVGTSTHWVPKDRILKRNRENIWQNLSAANLLHNYVTADYEQTAVVTEVNNTLDLSFVQAGLQNGIATVYIQAISDNVVFKDTAFGIYLKHLDSLFTPLPYTILPTGEIQEEVLFKVRLNNGLWDQTDTIKRIFYRQPFEMVFLETGDNLHRWFQRGNWGITKETYYSASASITESPTGKYQSNRNIDITTAQPISLRGTAAAFLRFRAKWDIEKDFDYAQILVSTDRKTFTPICGKYSSFRYVNQEPVYDGFQPDWIEEVVSLEDYLGKNIFLRFKFVSDRRVTYDGFYLDDLSVEVIQEDTRLAGKAVAAKIDELTIQPNPFSTNFTVTLSLAEEAKALRVTVVNAIGQVITSKSISDLKKGKNQFGLNGTNWKSGVYFVKLESKEKVWAVKKIVKNEL